MRHIDLITDPKNFSHYNVAGFCDAGISLATAPVAIEDGGIHGDVEDSEGNAGCSKWKNRPNKKGIIDMGRSENKLCFDLLQERLTQPDMLLMEPSLLQYPDWKGHCLYANIQSVECFSVIIVFIIRIPDAQRTHVMWGLSKDFAMAGVRVGTVYSENRDLVQALDQLGNFHGIARSLQHQVAQLLKDKGNFGQIYVRRGRHLWVLSSEYYLKEQTFVEELCLWRCFVKHRVLLSCGQAFSCSSPGWFRIVFSDQQRHLQLGLKRIRENHASSMLPTSEDTEKDKQRTPHREREKKLNTIPEK
ncbi:hypothetical protein MHYP_G00177270 [Metynnis hypsauchen]